MRFFKRAAVYLGFAHEANVKPDDNNNRNYNNYTNNSDDVRHNRMNVDPIPNGPRKGFTVPVQVPLDRQVVGPILYPSAQHHGGVQLCLLIESKAATPSKSSGIKQTFPYTNSLSESRKAPFSLSRLRPLLKEDKETSQVSMDKYQVKKQEEEDLKSNNQGYMGKRTKKCTSKRGYMGKRTKK